MRVLDMILDGLEPTDDDGQDMSTLDRLNLVRKSLKALLRPDQRKLM